MMSLEDIAEAEPDWEQVLVFADFCEDEGKTREAAALRWLYVWDHWPARIGCGAAWWFSDASACNWDRYVCEHDEQFSPHHPVIRATLPLVFSQAQMDAIYATEARTTCSCLDAFLCAFSNREPTPKLLPVVTHVPRPYPVLAEAVT